MFYRRTEAGIKPLAIIATFFGIGILVILVIYAAMVAMIMACLTGVLILGYFGPKVVVSIAKANVELAELKARKKTPLISYHLSEPSQELYSGTTVNGIPIENYHG